MSLSSVTRLAARRVAANSVGAVRCINLHEYQSKDVLDKFGVRTQKGKMADSVEDAKTVATWLKAENPEAELILKAQIHAGGRGKGTFTSGFKGGVQILDTAAEVEELTGKMLGQTLVTHQTGPEGQPCNKVLINEGVSIDRETYVAFVMDRDSGGPALVASAQGGMDIEEVAENSPDAIVKEYIDMEKGLLPAQAERVALELGFTGPQTAKAVEQLQNLYTLFIETDATQVEINPFIEGGIPGGEQGVVLCVDAKLNFDDNAAFRQKDIFALRDISMEDPRDVAAEDAGLNYIGLDGNIGCMVNGAGLAMATMDIIKFHGGDAANFLDVGGGATADQVAQALELLTSDKQVEAIMVNIFGGIMRCDTIAEGIVQALETVEVNVPLIVRLEGTNVEEGKKILAGCTVIDIISADDLDDAAKKAVASC